LRESGIPLDWWFILKASGCANASNPSCSRIFTYDPLSDNLNTTTPGPLIFPESLASSPSALKTTLESVSSGRLTGDTAAVYWNDDPPEKYLPLPQTEGSFNAHSKGVLAADSSGGVWLTHSWPEFPDRGWGISNASTLYGQSFLCVSLSLRSVEALAGALLKMEPRTYDSSVPPSLVSTLPLLAALAVGKRNASALKPTVLSLTSAPGGVRFVHVSKNGAWGGELYSGAVIPALGVGTDLWVETWRRSPVAYTQCSAPNGTAINVQNLRVVKGVSGPTELQRYTTDHSKWAIAVCPILSAQGGWRNDSVGVCSDDRFRPWICVGDINMMTSQAKRGGGTVCFEHLDLWLRLAGSVATADSCNGSSTSPLAFNSSSSAVMESYFTVSSTVSITQAPLSSSTGVVVIPSSPTNTPTGGVISWSSSSNSNSDALKNVGGVVGVAGLTIGAFLMLLLLIMGYLACRNRAEFIKPPALSATAPPHLSRSESHQWRVRELYFPNH